MTTTCWRSYTPTAATPWDLRRVVHLHLRAGFAATWPELRRDLADGPGPSIDRLLTGSSRTGTVPEEFADRAQRLVEAAVANNGPAELGAAWIYRMLHGPDPLGERLALMWHNHFATSNDKVNNFTALARQVALFREFGRAPFAELLGRVVRDPALLVYLDAPANRREHPNENLARELMELFTLGVGHYTEPDVREAARALTGWTLEQPWAREPGPRDVPLDQNRFLFDRRRHDDGEKTVLGRRGRWTGEDLLRLLLDHPATAGRLAWRLTTEFLGEGVATRAEVAALADFVRRHQLDVGLAVALILRSERFFAATTLRRRVPGPVEWAVALARRVLPLEPPPSLLRLAEFSAGLGQQLFYPPNVGGWPGGRSWLTPGALIARANLAADLLFGRLGTLAPAHVDVLGLARRHRADTSPQAVVAWLTELVFGAPPEPNWRERVLAACGPAADATDFARRAAAAILSAPEAQLG
jgi:uncharacterized protein (DUF1800 family)